MAKIKGAVVVNEERCKGCACPPTAALIPNFQNLTDALQHTPQKKVASHTRDATFLLFLLQLSNYTA